jgi:hypothetical protein
MWLIVALVLSPEISFAVTLPFASTTDATATRVYVGKVIALPCHSISGTSSVMLSANLPITSRLSISFKRYGAAIEGT